MERQFQISDALIRVRILLGNDLLWHETREQERLISPQTVIDARQPSSHHRDGLKVQEVVEMKQREGEMVFVPQQLIIRVRGSTCNDGDSGRNSSF